MFATFTVFPVGPAVARAEGQTCIVVPGGYEDIDLPGCSSATQMNVKVGVLETTRSMDEMLSAPSQARTRLRLLDLRQVRADTMLVLRAPRLSAPSEYEEMAWPATAEGIIGQVGYMLEASCTSEVASPGVFFFLGTSC